MTEQTPMERLGASADVREQISDMQNTITDAELYIEGVHEQLKQANIAVTRLTAENERLRGAIIKAEFTAYPAHGTGWVVHVTNHELTADAEALADPGAPGGEGDNV